MDEGDYQQWQLAVLKELFRVAKSGASLFYNHKIRQREGKLIHPLEWLLKCGGFTTEVDAGLRKSGEGKVAVGEPLPGLRDLKDPRSREYAIQSVQHLRTLWESREINLRWWEEELGTCHPE